MADRKMTKKILISLLFTVALSQNVYATDLGFCPNAEAIRIPTNPHLEFKPSGWGDTIEARIEEGLGNIFITCKYPKGTELTAVLRGFNFNSCYFAETNTKECSGAYNGCKIICNPLPSGK
jgi:hypothetical protein